jgi:hypothetical protein
MKAETYFFRLAALAAFLAGAFLLLTGSVATKSTARMTHFFKPLAVR